MLEALRRLSARIGADPLLVQAAGGNTSIKQDGVMWIKASGTWLKDAAAKDIFVPLDLTKLTAAISADDPACESCTDFVCQDINPLGLRPSIETSVHGLMPQRVVVHVHCVNTIAIAIQQNGEALAKRLLKDFNWAWVPYARPGLLLSRAIKQALRPGVDVLVLGNHGLVVAADTVTEAETLLAQVVTAMRQPTREIVRAIELPDISGYCLPTDEACHAIAFDDAFCAAACHQVFYPDHVVFLGTTVPAHPASAVPALCLPGQGVLVRNDASASVEPMLRCLGDVFARVPLGAQLKPLTSTEIDMLLNWEAEKYRQTIKQP